MNIDELLQTFLKVSLQDPARVQLLKGNGHKHIGIAAGIPQNMPLRM